MPIRARAAVVRRPGGEFAIEEVTFDDPRPREVLVRMVACGICHTDIAARDGNLGLPFPVVLGHEGAGIVEKTGPGVTGIHPGDPVVLSFSSCGTCPCCRSGHPAHCLEFDALNFDGRRQNGHPAILDAAGRPVAGSFFGHSSLAEYALADESGVVPVDVPPSLDQVAKLAPLGCGVQTGAGTVLHELRPQPGESVVVLGAGAVGLSAVLAARLAGAGPIVAVDIVPSRMVLALEMGATHVVDSRAGDTWERIAEIVGRADHVVETTGLSRMADMAVRCLAPTGKVSLVAIPADESDPITPAAPGRRQTVIHTIAGDSEPRTTIPKLIRHYREGRFPFDRMIREYSLEQINDAVRDARTGATVKPVIRFR